MIPRKQLLVVCIGVCVSSILVRSSPCNAFQPSTSYQAKPTLQHQPTFVPSSSSSSYKTINNNDVILYPTRSGLAMQPAKSVDESSSRRRTDKLSAVSIADDYFQGDKKSLFDMSDESTPDLDFVTSTILPVVSASLMVTGNCVGAGMLVLPELAAGPGMAISSAVFVGAFLVNLISGLLISEVAINQYNSSGSDVPSSFKEFAEVSLNSPSAANVISGISIFVNALVMAFNTAKVGDLGSAMVSGLPAEVVSLGWAAGCLALVGSLGLNALSGISSVMVAGLFMSFAGLLLPGLAHMTADPMSILMTPGTSPDVLGSSLHLAPIILMSLVYQNIVPTITKMLGYDRTKATAAITLGSLIPLVMYMAWAFCVVGGGVDMSSFTGVDGMLMSVFSLATIGGSSLGCIMSLAGEFDTFVDNNNKNSFQQQQEGNIVADSQVLQEQESTESSDDRFSLPSVAASVAVALLAGQFFSQDLNGALKVAGSFGSPLLYGILPVIMTLRQKQEQQQQQQKFPDFSLGLLGAASTGMVGNELLQSFGGCDQVMAMLSL